MAKLQNCRKDPLTYMTMTMSLAKHAPRWYATLFPAPYALACTNQSNQQASAHCADRHRSGPPGHARMLRRAVPILSLCSTTRRTEVEGQKRFSIDRHHRRLLDRRRRLLEVNSAIAAAVAGNDDIDAAASGKDDIDAATAAGNDEFAAAVACFNVAAATAAGKDDIDAAAAGKDDIDAAATGNDKFATAAACFNAAAAGKDEFDAATAACFNACRNPPLAAT
uniref:Uncharacterized protein n=1 Tax=Oryza rufipogon TaxID=4529 RepID=A0A0E0MWU9_ORYRU